MCKWRKCSQVKEGTWLLRNLMVGCSTRLDSHKEVMLARQITVLFGHQSIDWDELFNAYVLLSALPLPKNMQYLDVRSTGPVVVVMEMSAWTSLVIDRANLPTQVRPKMVQLLRSCLSRQSTDLRDRFYAVMGLAEDAANFGTPDYASSVETGYRDSMPQTLRMNGLVEVYPSLGRVHGVQDRDDRVDIFALELLGQTLNMLVVNGNEASADVHFLV
ncbi:hypothetical protein B0T10DRAFT_465916 [Thelonectria olida]|uniref:Uncharacterized protein n=1 Tax=Thelonectria olida TaxID=1576542 RepID=A0A9P9AIB0_9HYPO|nr:hypothetical protein B0T10DRAFT_465916 [Thelonectria olida]